MSVRVKEFQIGSKADGLLLSGMMVVPEDRPHGVVQIVHGMCEHKERYLDFMKFLANEGWIAVIHDNRGHGKSVKKQEDLGYFYEGGYRALVEDIEQVRAYVEEGLYEELPYVLLGHSMGSLAVRCYLQKYDDRIDKLVVIGSPSKPPILKPGLRLVKIVEKMKGEKSHSALLDKLISGPFEKPFKAENQPSAWICSDPAVVKAYTEDPDSGFPFTASGYRNLLELMVQTYSRKLYTGKHKDLPILFLSGGDDPCHYGKKCFGKTVHFMKKCGYKNVKAGLYAGMRHEILNEKHKKRVYHDILEWI